MTTNEIDEITLSNIKVQGKDTGFQCKEFFFTYHIKTENNFEISFKLLDTLICLCDKWVWGEEYGKSGDTPHIQGAFILKKRQRANYIAKHYFKDGVSFFKLRSFSNALIYCKKEQKKIVSSEEDKYVKEIENFYPWQLKCLKLLEEEPNDRDIHWFCEPTGGVGKTTLQKYIYTHYDKCIVLSGKNSDMKNGIAQLSFKPKIILINIPRSAIDFVSFAGIEEIKDMFFFSPKYESGMICELEPHVFVFANAPPCDEKLSGDKLIMHYL